MTDLHLAVTFFTNYAAATKTEQTLDLATLARRIETTAAATKSRLPWLKLARFGEIPTDKRSLRHDANMLAITGCEADYDGQDANFYVAALKLAGAELAAIIYTSPSHTHDAPRWRVLAPFSREYPPEFRDAFLNRLTGLFGGIFAAESWTRSQSYYFGSVRRNPSHRAVVVDGTPIDQRADLDAIAIGKPVKPEAIGERGPAIPREAIADVRISGKVQSLLGNVRRAADGSKRRLLIANGRTLGGYLHLTTWNEAQAVDALIEALPDSVEDWDYARELAAWAVKEGVAKPLQWTLPDRPYPGSVGRAA